MKVFISVFISVSILVSVGTYGIKFNERKDSNVQQKLLIPGEKICLGYIKVTSITENIIAGIDQRGRTYRFISNISQPEIDKLYALSGTTSTGGTIILESLAEYPFRKEKYLFSSLSIVLVLFLMYRYVRFSPGIFPLKMKIINKT